MDSLVTSNMYKILKHLYKKDQYTDTYENLPSPDKDVCIETVIALLLEYRLVSKRDSEKEPWNTNATPNYKGKPFQLNLLGVVYVENRIAAFRTWFIPVSISLFSVACSIAAIIISAIK